MYSLDKTIQKIMKEYMACRYGTAQGSILGPLILNLYVNDIFKPDYAQVLLFIKN